MARAFRPRCAAVGGGTLRIPQSLQGSYGVLLIYRRAWCPYCQAQLAGFQRASDKLAETGIKVVALSVDDEATTRELVAKHGLTFPVGHSADARAISEATGAFVNEDPLYLQSTGFVLGPDGRVIVSVYSSGAIGRLVPRGRRRHGPLHPGARGRRQLSAGRYASPFGRPSRARRRRSRP